MMRSLLAIAWAIPLVLVGACVNVDKPTQVVTCEKNGTCTDRRSEAGAGSEAQPRQDAVGNPNLDEGLVQDGPAVQDVPGVEDLSAVRDLPAVQDVLAVQDLPAVQDVPAVQDLPPSLVPDGPSDLPPTRVPDGGQDGPPDAPTGCPTRCRTGRYS